MSTPKLAKPITKGWRDKTVIKLLKKQKKVDTVTAQIKVAAGLTDLVKKP